MLKKKDCLVKGSRALSSLEIASRRKSSKASVRPFHPTAAEGKATGAGEPGRDGTVSRDKDYIEQKAPIFEKSASTSQREKLHREARSRVTSELPPRGGANSREEGEDRPAGRVEGSGARRGGEARRKGGRAVEIKSLPRLERSSKRHLFFRRLPPAARWIPE